MLEKINKGKNMNPHDKTTLKGASNEIWQTEIRNDDSSWISAEDALLSTSASIQTAPGVGRIYKSNQVKHRKLNLLGDFIASMTDKEALETFDRISV